MINDFLTKKYDEIVHMTEKITQDSNYRDIAHYVIEQFMVHDRAEELIVKNEAMRFLSGMIHRNYHSSTSPYHKLYRQKGRVFANDTLFRYTYSDWKVNGEDSYVPHSKMKGKETHREKIQGREADEYDYHTDLRLDAIEGILEDMQAEDQHHWYIANLFTMWIETPNYSELERKTKIPRTSISQAVNECREYIQQKLKEYGID